MQWDWKKLISVGAAVGNVSERSAPGGKSRQAPAAGPERAAAIAWRPAGLGSTGMPGSTVALQEERTHPCPFCHGRGALPGGSLCPVCGGGGKVHVEPPSVPCAFCGGQGQMPPRSNLSCWVCKGKGLVPVTPPVLVCPDCQGRGKKPCQALYCPRCRGVGVVDMTDGL